MTLDLYFARRFLGAFVPVLLGVTAFLALVDLVEQTRRFGAVADGGTSLLALAVLNLPSSLYGLLPLVVLIAALVLFLALARSSELVVARAAGRSALRALLGPVAAAALLGAAAVAGLNPVAAVTAREYAAREARLDGRPSVVAVAGDGVWLRQAGPEGPTVIHAARAEIDGTRLRRVTFLAYGPDGRPARRIEAAWAELGPRGWIARDARVWPLDADNPEAEATDADRLRVPSPLTAEQIRDSLGDPRAIPVWEMPAFIARLEQAGLAAHRHRTAFQAELAQPAWFVAMTLVAAAFTLQPQRGRRVAAAVLGAILAGFALSVLRNLGVILGEAGRVPAPLAAWAAPVAGISLALGLLLHREEG